MLRLGAYLLAATMVITVHLRAQESIDLSISLIISGGEAISIGRAIYRAPSFCLDGCHMWGTHQIAGASATYSWPNTTGMYEREIKDFANDGRCYIGRIEGFGSRGFYGRRETIEKCAPCVLALETYGSGSISGAAVGTASHNCGTGFTLTATPASGWRFTGWGGSITATSTSLSFTLDASKSLTAFFEELPGCPGGDANNNGICDAQESIDKDPNEDNCPGGPPCSSPVIINLGKGPWRLSGSSDPVQFDIDDDGVPNRITWTERESAIAFLALDRNNNGGIDTGAELFGNWTRLASGARAANGFEALEDLDSNGDGILGELDAAWSHLLLWIDANHDGVSQATELQAISGSTVTALETSSFWTGRRDVHGNLFAYQGRAYINDNPQPVYDIYFQSIP